MYYKLEQPIHYIIIVVKDGTGTAWTAFSSLGNYGMTIILGEVGSSMLVNALFNGALTQLSQYLQFSAESRRIQDLDRTPYAVNKSVAKFPNSRKALNKNLIDRGFTSKGQTPGGYVEYAHRWYKGLDKTKW